MPYSLLVFILNVEIHNVDGFGRYAFYNLFPELRLL